VARREAGCHEITVTRLAVNRHETAQCRRRPAARPVRRAALLMASILAVGGALTACGTDPQTTGAATDSPAASAGLLAYSSCMRSHGVPNFPDPASSGGIPKLTQQQLGVSQAQFAAAQSACQHLLPPGQSLSGQPQQTISAQQQADYLKAAACMRSHGLTNFPEPTFAGGRVEFPMLEHLVDLNSPQFSRAYKICRKLIPPGLPYSGSGG
jgi:hypothetical protein